MFVGHSVPPLTLATLANTLPDLANDQNTEQTANLNFDLPEIAANAEIFTPSDNLNLDDYTKVLESLPLNNIDIGNDIAAEPNGKDGAKQTKDSLKRVQRSKIIINDFVVNGNIAAILKPVPAKDDVSDDDFEDDQPCRMDELFLPNSNTDRNANEKLETECGVLSCDYKANKGWKQLTKHCVRQHPGVDIPNSFLSKNFNPHELMVTTFAPIVSKGPNGLLIQSLCYICNESYKMFSEKWLMHFIAHTGK